MIGLDPEHVSLARSAQRLSDVADPIHGVGRHPGKRYVGGHRPLDHRQGQSQLGREGRPLRHVGGSSARL